MPFELPAALFTIPTQDLGDNEELDAVAVTGFDPAPGPGAMCLIFPVRQGEQLRQITCVYEVASTTATGDRDWPWRLDVDPIPAPTPTRWYDIVEHLLVEGLKPVSGAYGEGDRVVHQPTIRAIYDLLGFPVTNR